MNAYFDNSATTKPCPEAITAITEALTDCWGNPSSLHGLGIEAHRRVEAARHSVAKALGAEPDRVFFTAGGTEADNWAAFSTAQRLGKRGRHIVTTQIEHHAILHPMRELEARGFEVTYLAPEADGTVTLDALRAALRPDTILVSVMMVNNEVGSVMPIQSMAKLTHRLAPNALFHTDAVQGFLKIPFRASNLEADLISVSSHKIHGPKGAGALFIRKGLSLPPYLHGGGQESGFRSGTEAVPNILGFGAACEAALSDLRADLARENALKERLRAGLAAIEGVVLNGAQTAPHIVSFAIPGVRSQGIINCLQDRGVYVSAGSACAKGRRSHVLEAMGIAPAVIDGSVRASLSRFTTEADVEALLAAVREAVRRLKQLG
ncbi:MAG: cysteine desulfurase [Oscillospiraceae bacterium]|nr:cysteine desulfurase [Oscillospiraceae bacterium]MBR4194606.1 cysteine desulfurase [Oscillospiraceae bacterium]